MKIRILHISLFAFSLCVLVQSAAADDIRYGEWNFTTSQSVPGLPSGSIVFRWRECLSDSHPVPTQYLQASSCDVLSQHFFYHTLRYKLSCFGQHGTFTNEGEIRFGKLRLNGRSKSDTGMVDGQHTVMRYVLQGTRAGDCDQ